MPRADTRAARFGAAYTPRRDHRSYAGCVGGALDPRRYRRLRRRRRPVFVRIIANVRAFTAAMADMSAVIAVQDARRVLWQAGLGGRMEELWPVVERLHRETELTLPEAAEQVASVAVRGSLL